MNIFQEKLNLKDPPPNTQIIQDMYVYSFLLRFQHKF